MSGYLGTKAVTLSTTTASVGGDSTVGGDLTVDTNTLYVDSTNNRVGVGTASPSNPFQVGTSDLIVDSSGNVGIGTSTVNRKLEISGNNNGGAKSNYIRITDTDTSATANNQQGGIEFYTSDSGNENVTASIENLYAGSGAGSELTFNTAPNGSSGVSERMRLTSTGNLLVGKTVEDSGVVGLEVDSDGKIAGTRDGSHVAIFNRLTSTGDIVHFRNDGTTIGRIGVASTRPYFANQSDVGLLFVGDDVRPCDSNGSSRDNAIDLGNNSNGRFDDIYATNGTIQTSDQNEKQQIASLTDAEITAAKAISKLFKTFKWNDSVAEKGDAARTHTGVIAQDVEQAMTDAGLNAGDYAFFISTTWWEADGEIYETAEEAPEGATERNRKGIRYPQLLSFIGAATEQRLASVEARLDALEGN